MSKRGRPESALEIDTERIDHLIADVPDEVFEEATSASDVFGSFLIQSYLNTETGVHFHFLFRWVEPVESRYLCAIFQKLGASSDQVGSLGVVPGHTKFEKTQVQYPVFVEVREPVEDGEPVSLRVVSVVRLQLLDHCDHFGRYGSDLPGIKIFNTSGDGEGAITSHLRGQLAPLMGFAKGEDKRVKSSTQIVEDVADDAADCQRGIFTNLELEAIYDIAALGLPIEGDFIWPRWAGQELAAFGLEAYEVLVGPAESFGDLSKAGAIGGNHEP